MGITIGYISVYVGIYVDIYDYSMYIHMVRIIIVLMSTRFIIIYHMCNCFIQQEELLEIFQVISQLLQENFLRRWKKAELALH